MAYPIPSMESVRASILSDWRNLDSQVTISTDSDNYIRASGFASGVAGLYQYATWGINQAFPDTADDAYLVRFASARGIVQRPASSATGNVRFTGNVGAAIPLATIIQADDGNQYKTSAASAIGIEGAAIVKATALATGPATNQLANTEGTLQTAPMGIDSAAVFLEMAGGVVAETMAELLARVLERLRQPPAGGNKYDWIRWAKEVPGVTSAFLYPGRRGIGSVDVAVLSAGQPPSEALRAAVTDHLDEQVPVGTDYMVLAPQKHVVDVLATVLLDDETALATVLAAAQQALASYFATFQPGSTVRRARIQTLLGDIKGVVDYTVTSPAGNVTTLVDATNVGMPFLGTITISKAAP